MIGRVGTLFGEAGVNIANMTVSRGTRGGKALMALTVDSPPLAGARRTAPRRRLRRRAGHRARPAHEPAAAGRSLWSASRAVPARRRASTHASRSSRRARRPARAPRRRRLRRSPRSSSRSVFICDGRPMLALVPATGAPTETKIARRRRRRRRRASRSRRGRAATGFEPGAVAPFPLRPSRRCSSSRSSSAMSRSGSAPARPAHGGIARRSTSSASRAPAPVDADRDITVRFGHRAHS